MKRFHVHIAVESIEQSVNFYNTLFGQAPTVSQDDYAKWMLDDPRINFAISKRVASAGRTGLDHLGFQLDTREELELFSSQLANRKLALTPVGEQNCCYAKSEKGWAYDPQGIAWERFVTVGNATTYGADDDGSRQYAFDASCRAATRTPTSAAKENPSSSGINCC
jgi:hypothetical protein